MGSLDRLIYVDDSGSPQFGWIVYGWVECSPAGWRKVLRTWLEFRKRLWVEHRIPPSAELHTADYINGRGRISTDTSITLWQDFGRMIAEEALAVLRDCEDLQFGSVYRKTDARGRDYAVERGEVYTQLVERWDREHAANDSFVFVSMDGDGSDKSYFDAHRSLKLDTRHVIEDPMFHDSKRSQFTQMADLVAFITYMHLDRHAKNEYAWTWFSTYLLPRCLPEMPLELKGTG